MIDFMFFVKTFFLTLVVVILMQIQIGERSIEQHAHGWVRSSTITAPLNSVAAGGAKMVRDSIAYVSARIRGEPKKSKEEPKNEEKKSSSFRWSWSQN